MNSPVSVLLPCYLLNSWLMESLASIEKSAKEVEVECLIVANNMKDVDVEKLQDLCRKVLTIDYRVINAGETDLVGALNFGVRSCRFDLIARMDQDDIMMPNRLKLQRDFMDSNEDYVLLGGSVEIVNEAGCQIRIQNYLSDSGKISYNLRNGNCFAHPAVMYRKSSVLSVGGYVNSFPYAEDYDLFVKLNSVGKSANLNQIILKYRINENQVSNKFRQAQILSTKCIIILQAIRRLSLEEKFPLPKESSQLHSWHRKIMRESIVGTFSLKKKTRAVSSNLRKGVSTSFIAIARSSDVRTASQNINILKQIIFAFMFSPKTVMKFVIRGGRQ